MIRTRFAPSPTGFMHIGGLRTALFCYLHAKKMGGKFILRIEDTDQSRFVEGAAEKIFETLKVAGLIYDEGPDVGGLYAPYTQSQRKELYLKHALELVAKGGAYYCDCKKTEEGEEAVVCACKGRQGEVDKAAPHVIRHATPAEGQTTFVDQVFGEITVENSEIDDQVLIKSDGMPTYNFANVVDDHAMAITHVMRGSEFLSSTPKHKLLYEAFGWGVPTFVHLPLIVRAGGGKLSKRDGDAYFEDYVGQGLLVEALVNFVALLGFAPSGEQEIFTLEELCQVFDIKGISKSPATFDMQKLRWMNGEYIKNMPLDKLMEVAKPYIDAAVKRDDIDKVALLDIVKSRIATLAEIPEMLDFIDVLPEYSTEIFINSKSKADEATAKNILTKILPKIEASKEGDDLYKILTDLAAEEGVKNPIVLWPVRCALAGKETSPGGASDLLKIFGKEESIKRIKAALEKLG